MRSLLVFFLLLSSFIELKSQCQIDTINEYYYSQSDFNLISRIIYKYDDFNRELGHEVHYLNSAGHLNYTAEKRVITYTNNGSNKAVKDTLFRLDNPTNDLVPNGINHYYYTQNNVLSYHIWTLGLRQNLKLYNSLDGLLFQEEDIYNDTASNSQFVTTCFFRYNADNLLSRKEEVEIRYSPGQRDTLRNIHKYYIYNDILLKEVQEIAWNKSLHKWEASEQVDYSYNHSKLVTEKKTSRFWNGQWNISEILRYKYNFVGQVTQEDNRRYNTTTNKVAVRTIKNYSYDKSNLVVYDEKRAFSDDMDSTFDGNKFTLSLDGQEGVTDSIIEYWDRSKADWRKVHKFSFSNVDRKRFSKTRHSWNETNGSWELKGKEEYDCYFHLNRTIFRVYPNPVNSFLTLQLPKGENYSIYNNAGQLVASGRTLYDLEELDLSSLKSGFYFIRAKDKVRRFTKL